MLVHCLVGGIPTPLKNMSSSVGIMTFTIYGKIKFMFETTNQLLFPFSFEFSLSTQGLQLGHVDLYPRSRVSS